MEKEKKTVFKKWWFWGIIILVIIVASSSGTTNDGSKTTLTSGNTTGSTSLNSQKTRYKVGEVFEDDTIAIKYVSLNNDFKGYSKYADVKKGYKIIKAEFEFENLSSGDQLVSSYDFNCYADGYDCEDFWSTENATFSATLSTGKKTKGAVYFEVPKEAKEIILEYETNIWTSSKIEFIVK